MSYGFYIKDGKPYYTDGTKSYPCSIAADKTTVEFSSGTTLVPSDVPEEKSTVVLSAAILHG